MNRTNSLFLNLHWGKSAHPTQTRAFSCSSPSMCSMDAYCRGMLRKKESLVTNAEAAEHCHPLLSSRASWLAKSIVKTQVLLSIELSDLEFPNEIPAVNNVFKKLKYLVLQKRSGGHGHMRSLASHIVMSLPNNSAYKDKAEKGLTKRCIYRSYPNWPRKTVSE